MEQQYVAMEQQFVAMEQQYVAMEQQFVAMEQQYVAHNRQDQFLELWSVNYNFIALISDLSLATIHKKDTIQLFINQSA